MNRFLQTVSTPENLNNEHIQKTSEKLGQECIAKLSQYLENHQAILNNHKSIKNLIKIVEHFKRNDSDDSKVETSKLERILEQVPQFILTIGENQVTIPYCRLNHLTPYFQDTKQIDSKEKLEININVQEENEKSQKILLDIFQKKYFQITSENVLDIASVATKYRLASFQTAIEDWLIERMNDRQLHSYLTIHVPPQDEDPLQHPLWPIALRFQLTNLQNLLLKPYVDDFLKASYSRCEKANEILKIHGSLILKVEIDLLKLEAEQLKQLLHLCPHIQEVTVKSSLSLTDEGFKELVQDLKTLNLTHLHVGYCKTLTDASIIEIKNLTSLKHLDLHEFNQLTDAAIHPLIEKLTQLKWINLRDCNKLTRELIDKLFETKNITYIGYSNQLVCKKTKF